ncbi:hypothetical protein [Microbacterium sp. TPD7012]|uniref:hypothetical protein n=1 Tax=Microbacterium sp. TPD7012 TaxID=2171975 RepID=UPI000D517458|nr:hypothetical protein [Microbacterium sp. TPD7012]PVE94998.1 hypothetical protein DC434_13820 [Microbacterium sp. TPD7012]
MADETTAVETQESATDTDEALGEGGLKALKAERERAAAAEKLASEREAKLKEYEDRDKSEEQKTLDRIAAAEKRAQDLELTANRATVAATTSVPMDVLAGPKSGSQEDIQAFADALIAWRGEPVQEQGEREYSIPAAGRRPELALNGDGIESALKSALGI